MELACRFWLLFLIALFPAMVRADKIAPNGPHWIPISSRMTDGRWAPSYSVLPGGHTALIAGGFSYATERCVATADIFDERTNAFRPAKGRMAIPRDFAPATLLPNGNVLICGGFNDLLGSLWSAELFDPVTETFTPTKGAMVVPRELFQATLLTDGRVLLTGGLNLGQHHTVSSVEIYDPASQAFTLTGSMSSDRFGHAACRLLDGRVLVVGGSTLALSRHTTGGPLANAEVYDPATGQFSPSGSMSAARDRPTASVLPDGRVIVIGGQGANGQSVTTAEIWDPSTGQFSIAASPTPLSPRMAHTATTLVGGAIVVVGGWDSSAKATTPSAVVYCATGASPGFASLPPLPFASHDAAAVAFADGRMLVAGGKSVTKAGVATSVDQGAALSGMLGSGVTTPASGRLQGKP